MFIIIGLLTSLQIIIPNATSRVPRHCHNTQRLIHEFKYLYHRKKVTIATNINLVRVPHYLILDLILKEPCQKFILVLILVRYSCDEFCTFKSY